MGKPSWDAGVCALLAWKTIAHRLSFGVEQWNAFRTRGRAGAEHSRVEKSPHAPVKWKREWSGLVYRYEAQNISSQLKTVVGFFKHQQRLVHTQRLGGTHFIKNRDWTRTQKPEGPPSVAMMSFLKASLCVQMSSGRKERGEKRERNPEVLCF